MLSLPYDAGTIFLLGMDSPPALVSYIGTQMVVTFFFATLNKTAPVYDWWELRSRLKSSLLPCRGDYLCLVAAQVKRAHTACRGWRAGMLVNCRIPPAKKSQLCALLQIHMGHAAFHACEEDGANA